jgi:predicted nuclease with TOPRIM domain
MSETFWAPEVAEQAQTETKPETQHQEPTPEPAALTMSVDDFSALEERILRAVNVVKRERQARTAAEERATKAEVELGEQAPRIEQLEKELHALHTERDHVRQRVERLLAQLDALDL